MNFRKLLKISKRIFIPILTFLLLVSVSSAQNDSGYFYSLYGMYARKDYFRFINYLKKEDNLLKNHEKIIINSLAKSIINRPAESNLLIDTLINHFAGSLNDSIKLELCETAVLNSIFICDYKKALLYNEIVLRDYKNLLDSEEVDEFNNSLVILNATKEVGKQTAEFKGDSKIKITNDLAGLANIPLKINGSEEEFIFDTGANISTIRNSLAKKLKLVFLKGSVKVGTMTGIKVDSELAYAETLEIGNMVFKNVLFIVLPDDALTFAGGFYNINGIIGFPVIKEMKEIHISKDELYINSKPTARQYQNLVLNGFTPVVNAVVNGDTLSFTFDTGAKSTILYVQYYNSHKKEIESKYKMRNIEIEGAGGKKKVKGFKINKINVSVAGSYMSLNNIRLLAEEIKDSDKYFYGNLGQDFFGEFDKMIINLESMFVEFVKK